VSDSFGGCSWLTTTFEICSVIVEISEIKILIF